MTPPPGAHTRRVRQQYDELAGRYDHRWAGYLARSARIALAGLSPPQAARVLDVGCGTGQILAALAERDDSLELYGVDLSLAMLTEARARLTSCAQLAQAEAQRLPFASGYFDWLYCTSMFHYLCEPSKALAEWRRVLKPGGTLHIVDWCRDYRSIRVLDWLLPRIDPGHHRSWSASGIGELLGAQGFTVITCQQHRMDAFWGLFSVTAHVSAMHDELAGGQ